MARNRGRPPHPDTLTPSEWAVAEMIRHGLTNKAIAARRGVSADAVKFHVGNILAKLGFSSRHQLRNWNGVRSDSALAKRETNMSTKTSIGPIGQVSRTVRDIESSTNWYRDILGLKFLYGFGDLAFFACGDTRLFLSASEEPGPESILYFSVEDIHGEAQRLEECGVKMTHAPHLVHKHEDGLEEWMAFFEDNEGRPLGIMEQLRQ